MKVKASGDLSVFLTQSPDALAKGDFVPAAQAPDEDKEHREPHAFRQPGTLESQGAEELPVNALQRVCQRRIVTAQRLFLPPAGRRGTT